MNFKGIPFLSRSKPALPLVTKFTITSHTPHTLPRPPVPQFHILARTSLFDKKVSRPVLTLYMPIHIELIPLRPRSTTPRQPPARRTIHRQREQILRFRVIGHKTGTHEEVDQAKEVHGEDEEENDVEDALPRVEDAGGVLLGGDGCVEGEVDAGIECVQAVIPGVVKG